MGGGGVPGEEMGRERCARRLEQTGQDSSAEEGEAWRERRGRGRAIGQRSECKRGFLI